MRIGAPLQAMLARVEHVVENGTTCPPIQREAPLARSQRQGVTLAERARAALRADHALAVASEVERTLPAGVPACVRDAVLRNLARTAPSWTELDALEGVTGAPADGLATGDDGTVSVVTTQVDPATGRRTTTVEERRPGTDEDAIVYVNGMCTDRAAAERQAAELSARTGKPVVVVYNRTQGFGPDLLQSIADKLDPFGLAHPNRATSAEADLMYAAAKSGGEHHFVCHSQGGIVTRNALVRVHARLYAEHYLEAVRAGHNPVAAHRRATRRSHEEMQNVHVVTAAGGAWGWPPYANVEHVSNVADPIPNCFGQTVLLDPRETFRELFGQDLGWLPENPRVDVVAEAPAQDDPIGHSFERTYLDAVVSHL